MKQRVRHIPTLAALIVALIVLVPCAPWAEPHHGEKVAPKHKSTPPSQPTIYFASPVVKGSKFWCISDLIYSEAFGRLGYDFQLLQLPYERGLLEANAGRVDGEIARIRFDESLTAQYPNLILAPESVYLMQISAFATNPSIAINTWKDFTQSTLTIGYPRGHKGCQKRVQEIIPKQRQFAFSDEKQGLDMLRRGRFDILVATRAIIDDLLSMSELKDSGVVLVGNLEKQPLYPCLHKRHRELAPKLASTLRDMKIDGTYKRLSNLAKQKINPCTGN